MNVLFIFLLPGVFTGPWIQDETDRRSRRRYSWIRKRANSHLVHFPGCASKNPDAQPSEPLGCDLTKNDGRLYSPNARLGIFLFLL
jgi:hypothetical protein